MGDLSRGLPAFFALAFGISWTCWIVAALSGESIATAWVRWLVYAGSCGPGLAALVLLYRNGAEPERAEFWDRVFELRRIRPRWLLVILFGYPVLTGLGVAIEALLFSEAGSASVPRSQVMDALLANPAILLAYAGLTLLLGPIPEELGWRGYALDRLKSGRSPLAASLLLGGAWAVWHLPEFVVPGTYQHDLGVGTAGFWTFMATAVGLSVLMTWIHDGTERSILAAILFHGAVNFTRATVTVSLTAEVLRTVLLIAAAAGIVLLWRRR